MTDILAATLQPHGDLSSINNSPSSLATCPIRLYFLMQPEVYDWFIFFITDPTLLPLHASDKTPALEEHDRLHQSAASFLKPFFPSPSSFNPSPVHSSDKRLLQSTTFFFSHYHPQSLSHHYLFKKYIYLAALGRSFGTWDLTDSLVVAQRALGSGVRGLSTRSSKA